MCTNFEFLKEKKRFKDFANSCMEAEKSIIVSPSTTAILSRRALELAVKWVYINDEDFVKLAENPRYYFSIEPEPLLEKYIEPTDEQVNYPLIKVSDITVYCRHYNSCKD